MTGQASRPRQVLAKVRTRTATLRAPVIPLKDYNPTTPVRGGHGRCLIAINVVVYFGVQPAARTRRQERVQLRARRHPLRAGEAAPAHRWSRSSHRARHSDQACGVAAPEASPTVPSSRTRTSTWPCSTRCSCTAACSHIGGNMLFLWIFGNNIEDRMGRVKYPIFYLLSGVVATLAHVARPARQHRAARSARPARSPA